MRRRKMTTFMALALATSMMSTVSAASATATAIVAGNVTITNNYGTPDKVSVTGISKADGQTIKVEVLKGTTVLKTLYENSTTTGAITTTKAIDLDTDGKILTTAGKLTFKVTGNGSDGKALTAASTSVSYLAEQAAPLVKTAVTDVKNGFGDNDSLKVSGTFKAGDTIKVYPYDSTTRKASTTTSGAIVIDSGNLSGGTITLKDLADAKGNVYVTYTKLDGAESKALTVAFPAEPKVTAQYLSKAKDPKDNKSANVTATNNQDGKPDYVQIAGGLDTDDIITVYTYDKSTKKYTSVATATTTDSAITTASAMAVKTTVITASTPKPTEPTTPTTSTGIKIALPANTIDADKGGVVYLTISKDTTKSNGANASAYISVTGKKADSPNISPSSVSVLNDDADKGDMIRVIGLQPDDKVFVYTDSAVVKAAPAYTTTSTAIVMGTVQAGKTAVTLKDFNLPAITGTAKNGTIYLVLQRGDMKLSKGATVKYLLEK